MTTDSGKRWAVTAGAVGLVGGLALGATGLAGAVAPSPSPDVRTQAGPGGEHRGPGQHKLRMGHRGAGGLVAAVSDTSLSLRTPRGIENITLNGSTTFYEGPTKASRSDVSVGDIVRVLLADPKADKPVASVVTVVPAHLAGWVTAINGSTITLTDLHGFTRTLTTSGSTKYRKDGADATAAAITVGSFIHAAGKVADNGTTLEATRVGVGLPKKGDRVREGKGRFGGPPPGDEPGSMGPVDDPNDEPQA